MSSGKCFKRVYITLIFNLMNKFFQFNEFVELGKVFKDCEAYLIALENFNRAIALSYLPINKERLVEAYDLRSSVLIQVIYLKNRNYIHK